MEVITCCLKPSYPRRVSWLWTLRASTTEPSSLRCIPPAWNAHVPNAVVRRRAFTVVTFDNLPTCQRAGIGSVDAHGAALLLRRRAVSSTDIH